MQKLGNNKATPRRAVVSIAAGLVGAAVLCQPGLAQAAHGGGGGGGFHGGGGGFHGGGGGFHGGGGGFHGGGGSMVAVFTVAVCTPGRFMAADFAAMGSTAASRTRMVVIGTMAGTTDATAGGGVVPG